MLPLLEIQGFSKSYATQDYSFTSIVDQFALSPGEIIGLTGPSGCGKSTILEMLALILKPDEAVCFEYNFGQEERNQFDIARLWRAKSQAVFSSIRRRHIGYVNQAGDLLPFLSVRQNILLPVILKTGSRSAGHPSMERLAVVLGITRLLDNMPETLSYGQRQRVAIARALVDGPDIVLADEPTSALDPQTADRTMKLFKEAAMEFGAALVIVSHDHALLEANGIPLAQLRRAASPENASVWQLDAKRELPENTAAETWRDTHKGAAQARNKGISKIHALFVIVCMGWRNFKYDGLLSFCSVLSFAAALTPILLLAGLRFGVVDTLTQRIMRNPDALAINPHGSGRLDRETISEFSSHPSVAFLVPSTRMLAASVVLTAKNGKRITADLVPTAKGDPLLAHFSIPDVDKSVVITERLSRELDLPAERPELVMTITRMSGGKFEKELAIAPVAGVIPDAGDQQPHIYAPLPMLEAVELYRDGYPVRDFGGDANSDFPARASYAGFRMYARSMEDVIILRDFLLSRGIGVVTQAAQIENLHALRKALMLVTLIVGGATCLGMALSLASSAVANVRAKENAIAQCLLIGFSNSLMPIFSLSQMFFRSIFATSFALLFYLAGASVFDWMWKSYMGQNETVCRITGEYVLILYGGAVLVSMICCVGAARSLLRIQPAEVLRRHA